MVEPAVPALDAFLEGRLELLTVVRSEIGLALQVRQQDPLRKSSVQAKERTVLGLLGEGASQKQIAYELGVSAPAVSHCVRGLLARLRLDQTMHLIILLRGIDGIGECELIASAEWVDRAHFLLRVDPDPDAVAILTLAELDVTLAALAGQANSTIAEQRQRSLRTVVNQLAAVFRKLGISGRLELASRLTRRGSCRHPSGKAAASALSSREGPETAASGYDGSPRWTKSPPAAALASATSIAGY